MEAMNDAIRIMSAGGGSSCLITKGAKITGSFRLWLEVAPITTADPSNWIDLTDEVNSLTEKWEKEESNAGNDGTGTGIGS